MKKELVSLFLQVEKIFLLVTIRFFNILRRSKVLDRQRILSEAARQGDREYRGQ